MAKNWAIVIGINQYEFLQPLKYAKRDAKLMAQFLASDAEFERVFLFSDDSPEIGGKSTRPFRSNILRVFREIFEIPFMGDGDNFWFFFAGHGIRYRDRDYLMPLDGDPHDIENTGISTNYLTERLRRCGADNVVMLLDACRNMDSRAGEGIGNQTAEKARQTGVISFFACSPNQFSHEVESIQQGAFTYAVLEGLGVRGKCATVERLNQYLEYRVPEILRDASLNVRQTPYTIAEPIERSHLILMAHYVSLAEIAVLKNDAYQAEIHEDWELAERLWIRILAAVSGQDMDAVKALQRIAQLQTRHSSSHENTDDAVLHTAQFSGDAGETTKVISSRSTSENRAKKQSKQIKVSFRAMAVCLLLALGLAGQQITQHFRNSPSPNDVLPTLEQGNPNPGTAISSSKVESLAATATTSFAQGNLRSGQEAVEELLDNNVVWAAEQAFQNVPLDKRRTPAMSFLLGRIAWQSIQNGNRNYSVEDVERYWQTAEQGGKKDAQIYNALGFVYYAQGDLPRASKAWQRASELAISQQKNSPSTVAGKENPAKEHELTAYAGLALVSNKPLKNQSAAERNRLRQKAVELRDAVLRQGSSEFQLNSLSQNWLWNETAIADWTVLLERK